MPTNPFFNHVTFTTEQDLIQDLIDEAIQIKGHSVYYLPREGVNESQLFGEDPLMIYPTAFEIEMYIKSIRMFEGASELMTKFGLLIEDKCVFSVSARRWQQEANTHAPTLTRPRENDIIWIQMTPTNRYLFNIQFVEDKEEFFELGKLYTYKLECELMQYSHERVQTNISAVDNVATSAAYTISLLLGSGSGTYANNELVYQGPNIIEATATGMVYGFNANTNTLLLQDVTGTFVGNVAIIGANGQYILSESPDTAPTVHDPLADNDFLTNHDSVIVIRKPNPRTS